MIIKGKKVIICFLWIMMVFSAEMVSSGQSLDSEKQENSTSGITVNYLRCEYRIDPLGIDTAEPRLSWIIKSNQRGQKQTTYQILRRFEDNRFQL